MKTLYWVFIIGVSSLLVFAIFISDVPQKKYDLFSTKSETYQNVYDDSEHTVYIKVDESLRGQENETLNDILNKKRAWERKFPKKKITAMTTVTGNNSTVGANTIGLFIHYEEL
jgi:hypothetical protein